MHILKNIQDASIYSDVFWESYTKSKYKWSRSNFLLSISNSLTDELHQFLFMGTPPSKIIKKKCDNLINFLMDNELVNEDYSLKYSLLPIKNSYSLVDHPFLITKKGFRLRHRLIRPTDFVFFGLDTFYLVEHILLNINNIQYETCLDLCCGSGNISFKLADYFDKIDSVDKNPRAIKLAKISNSLNNKNIIFHHADIKNFRSTRKYDLIVCNPPYVPTPYTQGYPLYGNGGPLGFDITQTALHLINNYLKSDGVAFVICLLNSDLLGNKDNFDSSLSISCYVINRFSPNEYAKTKGNVSETVWVNHLNQNNFEKLNICLLEIRRA